MVTAEAILNLREEIEEEKKNKSKWEASIAHWLDELHKEFGTRIIEEAKLQVEKMQKEINEAKENINELYEEIQELLEGEDD